MTDAPPAAAIADALHQASLSPCAKSQRGAVVFTVARTGHACVYGFGHNGQPAGFSCTGSAACRKHCGMICEHAEARAIRGAMSEGAHTRSLFDLVHVKAVDGSLVPSGGPSCVQCSRLIVDVGFINGVWLYELGEEQDTAAGLVTDERVRRAPPRRYPDRWHRYSAATFHRFTLRNCGMEV